MLEETLKQIQNTNLELYSKGVSAGQSITETGASVIDAFEQPVLQTTILKHRMSEFRAQLDEIKEYLVFAQQVKSVDVEFSDSKSPNVKPVEDVFGELADHFGYMSNIVNEHDKSNVQQILDHLVNK